MAATAAHSADFCALARAHGGDLRALFPTLLTPVDPSSNEKHSVCQPPSEGFKVRGKNYMNDRIKIKRPGNMQYTLIGIDYARGTNDREHSLTDVAGLPWLSLQKARERGFTGFVFMINFIVGFGNFICYWTPTRNFEEFRAAASEPPSLPRSLSTQNSESSSSSSISSQSSASSSEASSVPSHDDPGSMSRSKSYNTLSKKRPAPPILNRAKSQPPQGHLKPYLNGHKRFDKLMRRFVEGDDEYRNSRLKIIPLCIDGNYFLRNCVGRPAIVCNKIETQWLRDLSPERNYLEADIVISSSSMALTILGLVKRYMLSITIDLTFVIEAKHDAELPEELMCGLRFRCLNPDKGPTREELAHEYEMQQQAASEAEASESKNSTTAGAASANGSPAAPSSARRTNGAKSPSSSAKSPSSGAKSPSSGKKSKSKGTKSKSNGAKSPSGKKSKSNGAKSKSGGTVAGDSSGDR